ncbi:OLC1v1030946C1 [Oldenlandia corymbosa var. corymbosa]|uniref:OLC1v1030946C1 n=1 Tax=Oldenlandia corymbosa var. corymbosa TaxID=529605 RepID=A0AAV1CKQ6_OLDCO|nr:OLC1v1030946C1 [Oldenlandia corymbosa var. corymbosa]
MSEPHIPFTGGSSHRSPHRSPLHSRQHSAHRSPHHSSHQSPHHSSPTHRAFYRPIMSPRPRVNFSFTRFSSPRLLGVGLEILLLTFRFQQSSLDGHRYITRVTFFRVCSRVLRVASADNPGEVSVRGYQRHEEQGSSQTLGTPPLAVSKGQRVTKEPDRLTYSLFRAKKPKKK